MRTGDRVDVVLDCVTEEEDGRQVARVLVRLVDAPAGAGGAVPPPPIDGARRNVVQRWLGLDGRSFVAAFAIDVGPDPATGPGLLDAIRRYGDLCRDAPIEAECGFPVRAREIEAEAAGLLRTIEAALTPPTGEG